MPKIGALEGLSPEFFHQAGLSTRPVMIKLQVPFRSTPKYSKAYWPIIHSPHVGIQITKCAADSQFAGVDFVCTGRIMITNSSRMSNIAKVFPPSGLIDFGPYEAGGKAATRVHLYKQAGARQLASLSIGFDSATWLQFSSSEGPSTRIVYVVLFLHTDVDAIAKKEFTGKSGIFLVSCHKVKKWIDQPILDVLREAAIKQLP
jgi:hypothetical protein